MKAAVTMLVFCVAALLALGMVMLYSSSMAQAGARLLLMQLVWCAFGLGLCLAATLIDYRWLKKFAWKRKLQVGNAPLEFSAIKHCLSWK